MKKLIYLLCLVLMFKMVAATVTVDEGEKFAPSGLYNVTYRMNRTFNGITIIKLNSTCLTINTTVYCNSSATPITINISEVLVEDTAAPTYSNFQDNASGGTKNSTDVQLNVTIIDATAIDYYRIATNNTDGNVLTNQTIIDADNIASLTAIFNESLAWFPVTGGTLGWQIWANDTGGYSSVSSIQVVTIQATVDVIPPSNLTITVIRSSDNWITANCSADDSSTPITYDLWIEDTVSGVGIEWGSETGMTTCAKTFTQLWDHVTYRIYMNATDSVGNLGGANITHYTRPYQYRLGVHVGT
ncbi:hypothetical protein LCGC14_0363310 [marine sediment metagenome]|uniref:Fibronectin type-III domain-containing protein n=1 Tax=marine sediment metagenome TaxID=412755 RepID=A0A0F9T7E5_9ZZZZ